MTSGMVLQALRDSGEACSKGGLRLERLWVSWKDLGRKSPPDTSKCRLVCLASCAGVLSAFLLPPHSFLFFSVSISLQRSIYPSICIPGTPARDIGYNCVLVSSHSGTDMKIQFLLCVVWVSLLIWTSNLGQIWAAIMLPDVRSTLSDWPKSQKTTHHNFYTLAQPYVFGSMEPIKWGEGGWQLWH